jgi:hypothetical protein
MEHQRETIDTEEGVRIAHARLTSAQKNLWALSRSLSSRLLTPHPDKQQIDALRDDFANAVTAFRNAVEEVLSLS